MKQIQIQDFSSARPKLVPGDLKSTPCLLTLVSAEQVEVPDENANTGFRRALTLTFAEFPDKVLWLNRGQIETLITRLGDDMDRWVDATIPVESHVAEYRGQRFPKVRVVPDEGWDVLIKIQKGTRRSRPVAKATSGRR